MTSDNGRKEPTREPDAATVDALCREHLPLVHYEVRAISSRLPGHIYGDDLVSAGMAALVMAARSFDPDMGVPFGRYAVRRIRGALLDELRSADWATRSVRAKVRQRDTVNDELAAKLGRRPTDAEVAAAMNVSVADLGRLDADLHSSVVLRLDVITEAGGADDLLPSTTQTPEATMVARERQAYLRDAVEALPERLREVVIGCFFEERPMREIAVDLGVTESRVSQMRSEALRMLRDGLASQWDPAPATRPGASAPSAGGAVARRRAAYFAAIAGRSSYRDRLSETAEERAAHSA